MGPCCPPWAMAAGLLGMVASVRCAAGFAMRSGPPRLQLRLRATPQEARPGLPLESYDLLEAPSEGVVFKPRAQGAVGQTRRRVEPAWLHSGDFVTGAHNTPPPPPQPPAASIVSCPPEPVPAYAVQKRWVEALAINRDGNGTLETELDELWKEFEPHVVYLNRGERARVLSALRIAHVAHRGQKRKSGEPYISHPVAVAKLICGVMNDADAIAAGLLHDTVEDTPVTFDDLEILFGVEVRRIVEGETKVSKLPKAALRMDDAAGFVHDREKLIARKKEDEQAENLRQMFLAMCADYRIIIVKLADRLHNMRTLSHMTEPKQQAISRETLEIFAPLAHRLGIWQFKSELEDLSFSYLWPHEYSRLKRRLERREAKLREALDGTRRAISAALDSDARLAEQDCRWEIFSRKKDMYSLWQKLRSKKCDNRLDNVHDVVALRVVLDVPPREHESPEDHEARGVWLCYHVLSLTQQLPACEKVSNIVKDYISFPKPNGYQSLHTTIRRKGMCVEAQIRTKRMHTVAEYGMAAHWLYVDEKRGLAEMPSYRVAWLDTIKDWESDVRRPREFVDIVRRELLGKRRFVFLRDGKILNLSRGCTAIDAAFKIHTECGLHMVYAEINGNVVDPGYELQNGDRVNIVSSVYASPRLEWLNKAWSRSTRSTLRRYFRRFPVKSGPRQQ